MRGFFIRKNKLEPDFDFSKYLRKCASHMVTEQLETSTESWLVCILLFSIQIGVMHSGYVINKLKKAQWLAAPQSRQEKRDSP